MSSVRERNEPTEAGPGPTARRKENKDPSEKDTKKKQSQRHRSNEQGMTQLDEQKEDIKYVNAFSIHIIP